MRKITRVAVVAALASPVVLTGTAWADVTVTQGDSTITLPTCVDIAASPAVPGTPAVPAVPAVTHDVVVQDTPGQPFIAHVDAVAGVEGQPYIAPTEGVAGQPFIAHVDAVSEVVGQPFIASVVGVAGQPYIAPTSEIPGQPFIAHVDAVPGVPAVAEVSHTEYGFRTRVKLYGSKEVKSVQGYQFVSGSTTKVNGVTIPGHWAAAPSSTTYYDIPDVVINAVWGPSGVPAQYLGSGSVNLSTYGGPNHTVKYKAVKVQTDAGYTDWSDWSDYSTTNPGAATDLKDVRSKKVVTVEAKAAIPGKPEVVGQPFIAHVDATPGQPFIAHVDAVVGQPFIAHVDAVVGVEGQPFIAHVDANPGQPFIAHVDAVVGVEGQPYVAPTTHVETIVDKEAVPAKAAVKGVKAVKAFNCPTVLPHTGGDSGTNWAVAGAGLAFVALGTGGVLIARRRRS